MKDNNFVLSLLRLVSLLFSYSYIHFRCVQANGWSKSAVVNGQIKETLTSKWIFVVQAITTITIYLKINNLPFSSNFIPEEKEKTGNCVLVLEHEENWRKQISLPNAMPGMSCNLSVRIFTILAQYTIILWFELWMFLFLFET